jgi:hypothetical protein
MTGAGHLVMSICAVASASLLGNVEPQRRIGVFGIKCACLIDVGQGLGKLARIETQQSASKISLKKFRIELDCLIMVRDGATDVALVSVCVAAVAVGDGEFRIKPDLNQMSARPMTMRSLRSTAASVGTRLTISQATPESRSSCATWAAI